MKTNYLMMAVILLSLAIPGTQSQSANGASATGPHWDTTCVPQRQVSAISLLIGDSLISACSHIPTQIPNGATTLEGDINVEGPDPVSGITVSFTTATSGFTECTYGGESILSEQLSAGTGATIAFTITVPVTTKWCDGRILVTVAAGVVPTILARFYFTVGITREANHSLTYLCDATGTTPLAFDTSTGTCGSPSIRTYWCKASTSTTNPIPSSQCLNPAIFNFMCDAKASTSSCEPLGIRVYLCDATMAPATGSIPVTECTTPNLLTCQDSAPCHHILSGGNVSSNQTNSLFGDTTQAVTTWMPLWLGLILLYIAVMRPKPHYWLAGIAGALLITAAAYAPWPTRFDGYGARVVLGFLGAYLIILAGLDIKDWNEERRKKNAQEE